LYWINEEEVGTRRTFMKTMRKEMRTLRKHHKLVLNHKKHLRHLLENFKQDEVVIKCDFIQNIVHLRGRETSQSYYGKRQTQLLSFVVWYYVEENGVKVKKKRYIDYLSSYLKHNSLYFQKCATHLLTYLRDELNVDFRKVCAHVAMTGAPVMTFWCRCGSIPMVVRSISSPAFRFTFARSWQTFSVCDWSSSHAFGSGILLTLLSRHNCALDLCTIPPWERRVRFTWSSGEEWDQAVCA